MTLSLRRYPEGFRLLAAGLVLLCVAACESDQPSRQAMAANQHRKPPPPLAGSEKFFDGRISAELRTGAGFGDAGKADDATATPSGHRGGGGGMHGGGGRHGGGGGGGGGRGYGSDQPSVSDSIEQDQIANMRRAAANSGPPVIIHLRFTNLDSKPVELVVADFLSELGNFVVEPEKLTIDMGQSAEVEPMTSRLAGEISQAQITLTLRLDGHNETKAITLVQVPAPPEPPPASTPPPAAN